MYVRRAVVCCARLVLRLEEALVGERMGDGRRPRARWKRVSKKAKSRVEKPVGEWPRPSSTDCKLTSELRSKKLVGNGTVLR